MSEKTLCPLVSTGVQLIECRENCALWNESFKQCVIKCMNEELWKLNESLKDIFKAMERQRAMST